MEQTIENDEIDLLDLAGTLVKRKKMIAGVTLAAMIGSVAFAVLTIVLPPEISPLPNEYSPKAHMLINDANSTGGGAASLLASSGLGGLASLAGVNVGGSTYSALAVFIGGTNHFLDTLVDEFGLVERYDITKSPRTESRKELQKHLSVSFDEKTGVLTVAFTDIDGEFARRVVNRAVEYFENRFTEMGLDTSMREKQNLERNIDATFAEIGKLERQSRELEQSVSLGRAVSVPSIMLDMNRIQLELAAQQEVYKQLKVQYELLRVKLASEVPVFQVLEAAETPDKKSGPSRGMLCAVISFAAFFMAVILAFVLDAVDNVKRDPSALAKLKGGRA